MTREEIIDYICEIYEEYGIDQFGFSLMQLCNKMCINLIPYSSFEENKNLLLKLDEDAFCYFNSFNNKYEIVYNDEIKPFARIRFTIPHELGHIVLSHPIKSLFNLQYIWVQEREADIFANELYVPQAFIIYYSLKTKTDLMNAFHITESYASTLLKKVKQRTSLELSQNEEKLIKIFEKNKK